MITHLHYHSPIRLNSYTLCHIYITAHHEELKKDISNLRFELVNILHRRDRDTHDVTGQVKQLWTNIGQVNQKCDTIIKLLQQYASKAAKADASYIPPGSKTLFQTNQSSSPMKPSDSDSFFNSDPFSNIPNVKVSMASSSAISSANATMTNGRFTSGAGDFTGSHVTGSFGLGIPPTSSMTLLSGRISPASAFTELHGGPFDGASGISSKRVVTNTTHRVITAERKVNVRKVVIKQPDSSSNA